jgi:hypothetical protein
MRFNENGSIYGRVMSDAPETSVQAALTVPAAGHRAILEAETKNATNGLTSREGARLLPRDRDGNPQNSNRAASRFGELWELEKVAMLRERGVCILGVCHPHDKALKVIHKPSASCAIHGKIISRDGAGIWVSVEKELVDA